jgi:hypothetical protein
MRLQAVAVACLTFFAAFAATSAPAAVRIDRDPGGRIDQYLSRFEALRSSGEKVIVDGPCYSACTLLLGKLPKSQVCVTGRATMGFHAAWLPDERGRPVASRAWTSVLWQNYPEEIRRWISRHGGLTPRMIYLRGSELTSMYPRCAPGIEAGR